MKKTAILVALILAIVGALLLTVLPMSTNLIVAFAFYLVGLLMMLVGVFAIEKKSPASFATIFKCGMYADLSVLLSAVALIFSMKPTLHVILQIILLLLNLAKIALIDMGKNYIEKLDEKSMQKREGK